MTRHIFAIAAAAACLCFGIRSGEAQTYGDAPWCAQISVGTGSEEWLCYYNTVEECVPNVLAGNRGTCSVNPYYGARPYDAGSHGPVAQVIHRKRHAHWHE